MWPDKARTRVTVGHISCGLPEQAPWLLLAQLLTVCPSNSVVLTGFAWWT